MRRLAILCIGLAYVSACSSGKKSPLRSAPPPPSAPVAGPSLPGALPLPPAPAAEPVPIVMPVTLALSQPASTPLTPAELSSFQAFVQAQESRNTFAPDTYIFEFAKDERDLSSGQANILRQLRDPALCSTTNDFEDAKVDSFGAGTIYSYALKQGFDGTRCTLKYATNSLMKGRIESYDPETRKVYASGTHQ